MLQEPYVESLAAVLNSNLTALSVVPAAAAQP